MMDTARIMRLLGNTLPASLGARLQPAIVPAMAQGRSNTAAALGDVVVDMGTEAQGASSHRGVAVDAPPPPSARLDPVSVADLLRNAFVYPPHSIYEDVKLANQFDGFISRPAR